WEERSGGLGTSNTILGLAQGAEALYVGTEGGLFRSDDEGGTWRRLGASPPGVAAWPVAVDGQGRVWASWGGGVYASDDGGARWTRRFEARPAALTSAANGVVWALEPRRLLHVGAAEPGETPFGLGSDEHLLSAARSADRLWVGSSTGLWVLEGGRARRAWEGAGVLSLLPQPGGRIHAGMDGRGVVMFRLE
ncbi:MAG: hypothetical protein ACYDA8_15475, partial [Deferrisomatales bacterium]